MGISQKLSIIYDYERRNESNRGRWEDFLAIKVTVIENDVKQFCEALNGNSIVRK